MKSRKKRTQREEVRKILANMRLELAAQRLAQENNYKLDGAVSTSASIVRLDEVIKNSKYLVVG